MTFDPTNTPPAPEPSQAFPSLREQRFGGCPTCGKQGCVAGSHSAPGLSDWPQIDRVDLQAKAQAFEFADVFIEGYPLPPPGGMHVGMPKGVRVTHKPTGISVAVDSERSQHRNRDIALNRLSQLLAKHTFWTD